MSVAERAAAARAWIEGLDLLRMKFGLERIRLLLEALDHPERARPSLHVVGTNGKSSTSRLAAAALVGQGLSVGTYLSPHIEDWAERIEIDGRPLDDAAFADAADAVRAAAEGLGLPPEEGVTQFEALTAMAFQAFAAAGVDAAVVEAGLGGRYDATNVLAPDAAVILTNVALEHTDLLGSTEAAIAGEKLAVAADGCDRLVVGPLSPAAELAVRAEMDARDLRGATHGPELYSRQTPEGVDVVTPWATYTALPLPVHGAFQRQNLAVALAGAERLLGRSLEPEGLRRALAAVRIPGRLEVVGEAPLTVLDGAHNPAGMAALVDALPTIIGPRRCVAVVALLGDKDARGMIGQLAAAADAVVGTRSSHPRAVSPETLAALAAERGLDALAVEDPHEAMAAARTLAGPDGAVVVCGSLYLLSDLRPRLAPASETPPATLARLRLAAPPDD
ncbi:MAG: dihydrofolate synthase / folylpolyglutamate synthase [Miltoncostaeaceae bacterium]|jgi:dihydrofolate synthase/folylpolyglutamate synthase|nr:dihydrofolate synthase / folylpolyglutamate synthase [Miltoncostaeaceae bacterium]